MEDRIVVPPKTPMSHLAESVGVFVTQQEGMKDEDRTKFTSQLTLKSGDYPGLSCGPSNYTRSDKRAEGDRGGHVWPQRCGKGLAAVASLKTEESLPEPQEPKNQVLCWSLQKEHEPTYALVLDF